MVIGRLLRMNDTYPSPISINDVRCYQDQFEHLLEMVKTPLPDHFVDVNDMVLISNNHIAHLRKMVRKLFSFTSFKEVLS